MFSYVLQDFSFLGSSSCGQKLQQVHREVFEFCEITFVVVPLSKTTSFEGGSSIGQLAWFNLPQLTQARPAEAVRSLPPGIFEFCENTFVAVPLSKTTSFESGPSIGQ